MIRIFGKIFINIIVPSIMFKKIKKFTDKREYNLVQNQTKPSQTIGREECSWT